jgi:hypothetical protein
MLFQKPQTATLSSVQLACCQQSLRQIEQKAWMLRTLSERQLRQLDCRVMASGYPSQDSEEDQSVYIVGIRLIRLLITLCGFQKLAFCVMQQPLAYGGRYGSGAAGVDLKDRSLCRAFVGDTDVL